MLTYPNIDPVAIHLGPLQVHWYGLMYLLAFLCAWGLASYRAKQRDGWTSDMVSDLVFYGALGVVLGGRIGYVLFYEFDKFLENPIWLFQVWTGGMSFHGGFLGVMIAMLFWCKKYQKTWFQTLDFIAPCVPTGLMFGRFGNFMVESYMVVRLQIRTIHLDDLPTDPLHLVRHPSQIYQALCEGLILFIILWWFSSNLAHVWPFITILDGYGVARFVMEFFRQPDADQGFILFGWMTKGQILTVPMLLIGLWMMWYAYQKKIYDWGPQKNS
ncbi:prolipoprotein diacylglyceryl transferase [Acinetobacter seifertii]|nr:prolipoprotein diacylglyceryl transferase [Acinetobacter seifertii]